MARYTHNTRRDLGVVDPWVWALAVLVGVLVVGVVLVNAGVRLANLVSSAQDVSPDWIRLIVDVVLGRTRWTTGATMIVVMLVVLVVVAAFVVRALWRDGGRRQVDRMARYMGWGEEIDLLHEKHVTEVAARLHVEGSIGLPLGREVRTGTALYSTWEDMRVVIAGPRVGKTTGFAIPEIMAAPGAVLATSNKRDVIDATRLPRSGRGPVRAFDPLQIAGEKPSWWWNFAPYILRSTFAPEVQAQKLARRFADDTKDKSAQTDAYFDPAARTLLSGMFLAAALDGRLITAVIGWLVDPGERAPERIVRGHGIDLIADQLAGFMALPGDQQGGVYGSALQMVACLTSRQVLPWVTPGDGRREFDPAEFLNQSSTLYCLSREGDGSCGALVTALTVSVVEAAEELANHSPGGRLRVPLVCCLDEAANVCRWHEMPDQYSHYGSKGINMTAYLQSWAQGHDMYGAQGIDKLWSAANVKIYLGGVAEKGFTEDMSVAIGDYERVRTTVSYSKGVRSTSQSVHLERILPPSELQSLPRGRAVVFASGVRPCLIKPMPWMTADYAPQIKASLALNNPSTK